MNDVNLRPWKKEDAKRLSLIANDKNVWDNLRDTMPHPYTHADAEKWIAFCAAQKPVLNFAILHRAALVGSIGCVPQKDVYRKNMEIGYFIGAAYCNLGIATEAVKILLRYIEQSFDVVRIYAEVYAHNKASMKVLKKNGFYLESIRSKSAFKNNRFTDDYVWVKMTGEKL